MSDTFKRRRRRPGYKAIKLIPIESIPSAAIGKPELAACAAVAVVALALITLIWIGTFRAGQEQRAEIADRAEQVLVGQAATIAETIGHELLLIDQSLAIVQAAWAADSDHVDLRQWQQTMPGLMAVADDLFIADEQHVIRQDILPQAIGLTVGSVYVTFPHGALETYESDGTKTKETLMQQGQTGAPVEARQFLTYVVRQLDHPRGWLIGASYRSTELTRLFAQADLGINALVALVDTRRGVVQAIVGHAARRPRTDLSATPLFVAMGKAPNGTWQGDAGIDDVARMYAFHRVTDRDIAVITAAASAEMTLPAESLVAGARSLATLGSAVIVLIGGLVLWELYSVRGHRRRQRILERNRTELDRLRFDDVATQARARINATRLQVVLNHTSDGIALFDLSQLLVQWNHPFSRGIGIVLSQAMPLDTLLRQQAAKGMFGGAVRLETEIALRADILRTGNPAGLTQLGPDDEILVLRGLPIPEGGFMLLLNGLTRWEPAPPAPRSTESDEPALIAGVAVPIEW